MVILTFLYFLTCALCAFMGRNTRAGALGQFLIAIVATPLVAFVLQWAGRPSQRSPRNGHSK